MKYPDDFINKVIIGNHLEIMPDIPDEVIDLTVTSPPYDNLRDYQGYDFKFEPLAKELYRVTKQGGVVVWVVGDATIDGSETGTSFRQALYFKEIGFNLHDTMIYEKQNPIPYQGDRYQPCFEYMFVFSKEKPKTFNPFMVKTTSKEILGFGHRDKDGEQRRLNKKCIIKEERKKHNIFKYSVGGGNLTRDKVSYQHPAIFPEDLARDHILSWSNPGNIILDPMCGSGTTCKMAKQYNRKYIGIDLGYEEIANERLRQEVLPL